MISSFVSRDFGYGFDLTEEQLQKINAHREEKMYLDCDAASKINGNAFKKKLTSSPFTKWLDYGQNSKGYWNYDHMILQLEDVIDILRVLFEDKYDYTTCFSLITRQCMNDNVLMA